MTRSRWLTTASMIRGASIASLALLSLAACEGGPVQPDSLGVPELTDQALGGSAQLGFAGSAAGRETLEYAPVFLHPGTGELEPMVTLEGSGVRLHVEQAWAEGSNDLRLTLRVENATAAGHWGLVRIHVAAVRPPRTQVHGYDGEAPILDLSGHFGGSGSLAPGQLSDARELTVSLRGNAAQMARSLRITFEVETASPAIEVPVNFSFHPQPWPQDVEVAWCHHGDGIVRFEMEYREPGEDWEFFGSFTHFWDDDGFSCPNHVWYLTFRGGQTLEFRLRACDAYQCSAYTDPVTLVTPPLALVELKYSEGGIFELDGYWVPPESEEEGYRSWLVDRYTLIFPWAMADDGWEIASYSGPWPAYLSPDGTMVMWAGVIEDEGPYTFEVVFAMKEP